MLHGCGLSKRFTNFINRFFVKRVSNFLNGYMGEALLKGAANFINGLFVKRCLKIRQCVHG